MGTSMGRGPTPGRALPRRGALALAGAALAAVAVGFIWYLKALPYSTSTLVSVERGEAERAPGPDEHRVGPLVWEFERYRRDQGLEPLRRFKKEQCGDKEGVLAAMCLSDALADRVPNGAPRREFVDANYDLLADFSEHLAGAPGHCVTRSGLITTMLLSSGIRARVAQFVAPGGDGHNVLEVWSEGEGWVLVDPSLGGTLSNGRAPLSAAAAATEHGVRWQQRGRSPSPQSAPANVYEAPTGALVPGSQVLYPDPWLYTRSGSSAARWPFRGAFAHVNSSFSWEIGAAQSMCHYGALASALGALLMLGLCFAPRPRLEEPEPIEAPVLQET
jgi:hypothetical protein